MHTLPRNGVGAELGVCKGENAVNLLHYSRAKKLYLVDPWDNKEPLGEEGNPNHITAPEYFLFEKYGRNYQTLVQKIFKDEVESGKVVTIRSYAKPWLDSCNILFDWIYIDTTHTFDETFETVESSVNVLKKGGVLGIHDYETGFPCGWDTMTPVMYFMGTFLYPVAWAGVDRGITLFCKKI